ncbi:MAG TPA: hypothetical protein VGR73_09250 [Bryobacteraceae bacterium]|nr:hypothetical protein [Bryobacteraceae bacterium]
MKVLLEKMWTESTALTLCCAVMLAAFIACALGIVIDPRTIAGVPAWLKPAKFAISSAIFAGTIAWLFQYITIWPRFKRIAGWMLSIILVLEVGIIDVQAARGTTSHFNVGTPVDSALFLIMGVAIGVLWAISVGIAYALFRQPFANQTWGWSLRLGMLIFVLGAATGGIMLSPAPEQRQALAGHQNVASIGGHTVGAPDGGEGLPGVGWSLQHGDLRIPHFFGLHALQILPFLGWLILRYRGPTRLLFTAAAAYLALIGILTWQALRGQSVVEPDAATLAAFAIWAMVTAAAAAIWSRRGAEQL